MSGWRSSTMRESVLEAFAMKGFLPLKEVAP